MPEALLAPAPLRRRRAPGEEGRRGATGLTREPRAAVFQGIPGEDGYRGYPGDEGGPVSACCLFRELLSAVPSVLGRVVSSAVQSLMAFSLRENSSSNILNSFPQSSTLWKVVS